MSVYIILNKKMKTQDKIFDYVHITLYIRIGAYK